MVYRIFDKVAKNHRNKAFGIYDEDDIEQEVWLICGAVIHLFKPSRRKIKNMESALENWLNSVVSNRLINFHRDKFVGKPKPFKSDRGQRLFQQKFNLAYPLNIEDIPEDALDVEHCLMDEDGKLITGDLHEYIIDILEAYLSGEIIKPYYRNMMFQAIKDDITLKS